MLVREGAYILYCHCAHTQLVTAEVRTAILERLGATETSFYAVPDLCALSARKDPILKRLAEAGAVKIVACFPRAVRWLFHAADAALPMEGVKLLNMRKQPAEPIIESTAPSAHAFRGAVTTSATNAHSLRLVLYEGHGSAALEDRRRARLLIALLEAGYSVHRMGGECEILFAGSVPALVLGEFNGDPPARFNGIESEGPIHVRDITALDAEDVLSEVHHVEEELGVRKPGGWKPWFPVIDYNRCTNCLQCLSFCLFGVFAVNKERRIEVRSPKLCKTDCPACARVCPEVAILFPKYCSGPINGDTVHTEDFQREAVKVDVSALLGGDAYATLRSRRRRTKQRFSTERTRARALLERRRWLERTSGDSGIPDEVQTGPSTAKEGDGQVGGVADPLARRRAAIPATGEPDAPPSEEEWGI